ncbi:MAG: DNA primase [Acetobacteraceae bacterium]|nr:DNA primase [Acetobacteraceae bacterium]
MALPAAFLDELRARTPLATVVGRRVKLARSGRNWKGCCPFHNEKTPSFYVYDNGYHCFGCGQHGDAISFVMQAQGMGFMEAVELLAGEAGLEVPKPTPAAAEAERLRHSLQDVLAAAEAAYARRLHLPEGARALAYLRGRGLTEATIARFGLGWSGETRGAIAADLAREGIAPALLLEAGLLRPGDEGRAPYDLFYNRVMFPIRDRRGRVISFGGRILGDGQPKYVNGPETPVFSKRRTLFGLDLAREAARNGAAVVAVEGYMDVIALHQAGFGGAVAPLGTALSEEQLEELWRLSPAPVLCFDGDAAGARAAARAAELALPMLGAERSLRLATLPAGEDPDMLVRRQGPPGFQGVLEAARPLAEALYDLLAEGVAPTVEARAGLARRLEAVADRVADKPLAWEFRRYFRDRMRARRREGATWSARAGRPTGQFGGTFAPLRPPLRIRRVPPGAAPAAAERGRALVAILLHHPGLLPDVEEAFASLDLAADLARLRDAILQWSQTAQMLDSAGLMSHLNGSGLAAEAAQALSAVPVPLPGCAAADAMPAEAGAGWWHFFGLMNPERLDEEVEAARTAFALQADEAAQRRLILLTATRAALLRGEAGETDDP